MDNDMQVYWIALSFWRGLGPRTALKVLEEYETPKAFFDAFNRSPQSIALPVRVDRKVKTDLLLKRAEKTLTLSKTGAFQCITLDDSAYPPLLAAIPDPPLVIYSRGDASLMKNNCIAIIGTRNPTQYGMTVAKNLSRDLAVCKLTIVSGLALGIDAIAHEAALDADGKTIAVIGCGLDSKYPVSNEKLRSRIEQSGLVATEYPWGTEPVPSNYPRRNRIISGLSSGVLLIEAREKSGALITVNEGLDQGREIFAVPGSITSAASRGALILIQQGAIPVINAQDVLNHLPHFCIPNRGDVPVSYPTERIPEGLPREWERLWKSLSHEPISLDDLVASIQMPVQAVSNAMLQLELEGWVTQLPGKKYIVNPDLGRR